MQRSISLLITLFLFCSNVFAKGDSSVFEYALSNRLLRQQTANLRSIINPTNPPCPENSLNQEVRSQLPLSNLCVDRAKYFEEKGRVHFDSQFLELVMEECKCLIDGKTVDSVGFIAENKTRDYARNLEVYSKLFAYQRNGLVTTVTSWSADPKVQSQLVDAYTQEQFQSEITKAENDTKKLFAGSNTSGLKLHQLTKNELTDLLQSESSECLSLREYTLFKQIPQEPRAYELIAKDSNVDSWDFKDLSKDFQKMTAKAGFFSIGDLKRKVFNPQFHATEEEKAIYDIYLKMEFLARNPTFQYFLASEAPKKKKEELLNLIREGYQVDLKTCADDSFSNKCQQDLASRPTFYNHQKKMAAFFDNKEVIDHTTKESNRMYLESLKNLASDVSRAPIIPSEISTTLNPASFTRPDKNPSRVHYEKYCYPIAESSINSERGLLDEFNFQISNDFNLSKDDGKYKNAQKFLCEQKRADGSSPPVVMNLSDYLKTNCSSGCDESRKRQVISDYFTKFNKLPTGEALISPEPQVALENFLKNAQFKNVEDEAIARNYGSKLTREQRMRRISRKYKADGTALYQEPLGSSTSMVSNATKASASPVNHSPVPAEAKAELENTSANFSSSIAETASTSSFPATSQNVSALRDSRNIKGADIDQDREHLLSQLKDAESRLAESTANRKKLEDEKIGLYEQRQLQLNNEVNGLKKTIADLERASAEQKIQEERAASEEVREASQSQDRNENDSIDFASDSQSVSSSGRSLASIPNSANSGGVAAPAAVGLSSGNQNAISKSSQSTLTATTFNEALLAKYGIVAKPVNDNATLIVNAEADMSQLKLLNSKTIEGQNPLIVTAEVYAAFKKGSESVLKKYESFFNASNSPVVKYTVQTDGQKPFQLIAVKEQGKLVIQPVRTVTRAQMIQALQQ